MSEGLFSTYRGGENRVTASTLAVLRSLSISRVERLLGALLEQPEFQLVRFSNQPSRGGEGVPDAEIAASLRLLVETKLQPNTISVEQLKRHLRRLDDGAERSRGLLVLTPDESRPAVLSDINDDRLTWTSFAALDQAIDELLADKTEVVSEREAFLLRELQALLENEGLVRSARNVVVVAARRAWPEYRRLHAYVCQPGRAFQTVQYLAFYTDGEIKPVVPRVVEVHDSVVAEEGRYEGPLGDVVDRMIDLGLRATGAEHKIFVLSDADAEDTAKLTGPVANDLRGTTGRPIAFTQGHRYVSLESLLGARTTSVLAADS